MSAWYTANLGIINKNGHLNNTCHKDDIDLQELIEYHVIKN